MVSRRSESTLYMQSNMMADSKQDLLQMDISPKNLLNPFILEWFPQGASEWLFSYPSSTILEIWGPDVGNAYFDAYTDEKLCIIAGPEFKELQCHLLIMIKALYGTHSGGARCHDRLVDILQELKFRPSKADPDVWMRPEQGGTCYEYIAVTLQPRPTLN